MRIVRFAHSGGMSFGAVHGDPRQGPGHARVAEIADHPFGEPSFTGRTWDLDDVRLLAPILPSKILGIGKNYADHAAEMTDLTGAPRVRSTASPPLIFIKPSTTVIGPGAPIRLPWDAERVDHEAELAVVIGTVARDVTPEDALAAVLGYTCGNDVTARDQQRADGQWARAKGHDTFCPLGPWIETELDPFDLEVTATVDGEPRQSGRTSDMIHDVRDLIAFVTSVMTLLPGDVILTGTPAGVGPLQPGQSVSVTIEGIGTLTNPVEER